MNNDQQTIQLLGQQNDFLWKVARDYQNTAEGLRARIAELEAQLNQQTDEPESED